jgi:hypothetical protein
MANDDVKKPLTTSSPSSLSSLSDHLFLNDIIILPKPILKKSNQQSSPSNHHNQKTISPKPIPRSTLKQSNQDETLV